MPYGVPAASNIVQQFIMQFGGVPITFNGTQVNYAAGDITVLNVSTDVTYDGVNAFVFHTVGIYEIAISVQIDAGAAWPDGQSSFGCALGSGLPANFTAHSRNPGAAPLNPHQVDWTDLIYFQVAAINTTNQLGIYCTSATAPGTVAGAVGIARITKLG